MAYYGQQCATKLEVIGIQNGCIRPYYNDSRVAGWLFGGEWQPDVLPKDSFIINKYWDFFYNQVHWNGSQTGFAGIYALISPDQPDGLAVVRHRIYRLKELFRPGNPNGLPEPNLVGFEWYGNGNYNLSNVAADLRTLAGWMMNDVYYVLPHEIELMEGGSDPTTNPARPRFYTDAIEAAARLDGFNPSAGIFLLEQRWLCKLGHCVRDVASSQDKFSIFNNSISQNSPTDWTCILFTTNECRH